MRNKLSYKYNYGPSRKTGLYIQIDEDHTAYYNVLLLVQKLSPKHTTGKILISYTPKSGYIKCKRSKTLKQIKEEQHNHYGREEHYYIDYADKEKYKLETIHLTLSFVEKLRTFIYIKVLPTKRKK